jgi:hypothetical protein
MYNVILTRVRLTTVAVEKRKVLHILGFSSMKGDGAVPSTVACTALPYLSKKKKKNGTSFGTEVTEHKMCGFIFTTTFVRNISDKVTEMLSQMYTGLHVKYPFFLSDF